MRHLCVILICVSAAFTVCAAERTSITDFHNFPNPFEPDAQAAAFVLQLDGSAGLVQADASVYNALGEIVYTQEEIASYADTNTGVLFYWRGVNSDGNVVASGLYYTRVKVRTDDGDILVATTKTVVR